MNTYGSHRADHEASKGSVAGFKSAVRHNAKAKALKKKSKDSDLEARSKKSGFYVHGHKNFGDVYEA